MNKLDKYIIGAVLVVVLAVVVVGYTASPTGFFTLNEIEVPVGDIEPVEGQLAPKFCRICNNAKACSADGVCEANSLASVGPVTASDLSVTGNITADNIVANFGWFNQLYVTDWIHTQSLDVFGTLSADSAVIEGTIIGDHGQLLTLTTNDVTFNELKPGGIECPAAYGYDRLTVVGKDEYGAWKCQAINLSTSPVYCSWQETTFDYNRGNFSCRYGKKITAGGASCGSGYLKTNMRIRNASYEDMWSVDCPDSAYNNKVSLRCCYYN